VVFDGTVNVPLKTVTGTLGQTLYATVRSINNAGIESTTASQSAGATVLLDPAGDYDGDGQTNASEEFAGTDPLDNNSVLIVVNIVRLDATTVRLTWQSVPGKDYEIDSSPHVLTPFTYLSGPIPAAGATTSFNDTAATGARKYYKVRVVESGS
jgi:hypothetical protein